MAKEQVRPRYVSRLLPCSRQTWFVHPSTAQPAPGRAVSVTFVPVGKDALQLARQARPAGELEIVPVPDPPK
jgi:hypothetical protein